MTFDSKLRCPDCLVILSTLNYARWVQISNETAAAPLLHPPLAHCYGQEPAGDPAGDPNPGLCDERVLCSALPPFSANRNQ